MSTIKYGTRGFKIGDTVYIPQYNMNINSCGHRECIINSFSVETLVEKNTRGVYINKSKVFVNVTWIRTNERSTYPVSSLYRTRRGANRRAVNEYKDFIRERHGREITRQEQEIERYKQRIKDCQKDIKSMQKVLKSL